MTRVYGRRLANITGGQFLVVLWVWDVGELLVKMFKKSLGSEGWVSVKYCSF